MKHKGHIIITKSTGGDDPRCVTIRVEDTSSGVVVLEAFLTPEEYANASFSSYTPCEFEVTGAHLAGCTNEHKEVQIRWAVEDHDLSDHQQQIMAEKMVKKHEVDGWRGCTKDLFNRHRFNNKTGAFRVGFHRYLRDGKPVLHPEKVSGE